MNGNNENPVGAEKRVFVMLEGTTQQGLPVIDKREATTFTENGLNESVAIRLRYAGCVHVMQTAGHIGGLCSNPRCQRVLCSRCANTDKSLCAICHQLFCANCLSHEVEIDEEKEVVCENCYRSEFFWREVTETAGWAILIILGFCLLRSLL